MKKQHKKNLKSLEQKKNSQTFKLDTKARPLSWSAIASFQYDPESWYLKYVLGMEQKTNPKMEFGKIVDKRIQTDPNFLPEVPRLPLFQHKLYGKIGDIHMVGLFDGFRKDPPSLLEYKTYSNDKWNQKTAQEHGQILFYLGLIWLNYGITPDKVDTHLVAIPCRETGTFDIELSGEPVKIFKVKHTITELLTFFSYIKRIVKDMEVYTQNRVL